MKYIKKCLVCGKNFEKKITRSKKSWATAKFCSNPCINIGRVSKLRGVPLSEERKLHLHKVLLGRTCNTGKTHFKKGIHPSVKTEFKQGNIPWLKGKLNPSFTGENNPRWKGGIYPENLKIRHSVKMKNLNKEVLKRDNYTCQDCGIRGVKLNVHHIKPFAIYPELRFDINNLVTVCEIKCHKNRHSTI
jgi:hypothetical protein